MAQISFHTTPEFEKALAARGLTVEARNSGDGFAYAHARRRGEPAR